MAITTNRARAGFDKSGTQDDGAAMLLASLVLDPRLVVADIHRRTFGSFVEHMGRCVYTGIFEPEHAAADDDGHRADVLRLTLRTEPGGPAWRQASFHPFAHASRFARGRVLHAEPVSPVYDTAEYGPAPVVHAVATHDPESDEVAIFAVNRHERDDVALSIGTRALPDHRFVEHSVLDGDPRACNTQARPGRVVPRRTDAVERHADGLEVALAPVSWNVIRLRRDSAPERGRG